MGKGPKTISLDNDILEDIKRNSNYYGFNFSEWVTNQYRREFMDIDQKLQRIKSLQEEAEKLQKEVDHTKIRIKTLSEALSRQEIRYLQNVPRLISEGKEIDAICRMFNITYHNDMTIQEFVKAYKFFENEDNKTKRKN